MRVLDLFSGIGGFSLGLERTGGFRTVAFCEIDPFCRRVLAKHWPEVPCYHDVRELSADRLAADGIAVDAICGGFPCQDLSFASGRGAGLDGERSGLWSEVARLAGELRPRFVIVENVSALLARGLDRVLGDLAEIGFDAEWHCIPASAVGAPHRRDRLWLVAYPNGESEHAGAVHAEVAVPSSAVADTNGERWGLEQRIEGSPRARSRDQSHWSGSGNLAHTNGSRLEILFNGAPGQLAASVGAHDWSAEPDVGRVAHGVPSRVDRLRCLGNAVVPQIPEMIGRAILRAGAGGEP
jgi:DNA (cytosine-5)-methyltransferase 1